MKNKIKKAGYALASAALISAPLATFAQFEKPGNTNLPGGSIFEIIRQGMMWLLALVGIIGIIGFAIAGIMYLTSAGNETQIEKAKKAMLMAILGVIVALVGLVIMQAVEIWLGGRSSRF